MEFFIGDILSNSNTGRDADDLLRTILQGPGSDDNLGADDILGADDTYWVESWKDLINLPSSLYIVPDGSVG